MADHSLNTIPPHSSWSSMSIQRWLQKWRQLNRWFCEEFRRFIFTGQERSSHTLLWSPAVLYPQVRKEVTILCSNLMMEVCGSYRRGKQTCGDIDILITHPDGQSHRGVFSKLLTKLHDTGVLICLGGGSNSKQGLQSLSLSECLNSVLFPTLLLLHASWVNRSPLHWFDS